MESVVFLLFKKIFYSVYAEYINSHHPAYYTFSKLFLPLIILIVVFNLPKAPFLKATLSHSNHN